MSFRSKLILSLGLLLVPLIAGDAYFHYQHYKDSRNEALARQMDAAQDLARGADLFVDRTVAVQRAVGQALAKSHWHSMQVRRAYVESVLASTPPLLQIAFADPSGKVVEGAPGFVIGHDISDKDYFRKIRNGADWAVSDHMVDRMCGLCGFLVATGVRDRRGAFLGVVISGVDEKRLMSVLHLQTSPNARLVLVDTKRRLTFMSSRSDISAAGRDWQRYGFVQEALRGKKQYVERLSLPDQPILTGAMVPIPALGWAAGAFVPQEQVAGPVREMVLKDLAVTVAVLALTFLVGSLVAKQMIAPVEHLSDAAEKLGKGELDVRAPVVGATELRTLARTMNQMAESVQQAYERERRIATTLQQRMLPRVPTRIGDIEVATGYFPALEEAELGGDFYDAVILPGGLVGVVIADVSGKGLSAAVHTAMVKYTLEGFAYESPSPALVLSRVNKAFAAQPDVDKEDAFVTAFFAVLDPRSGRLRYSNAGHPAPLLRQRSGDITLLTAGSGLPLGIADEAEYEEHETALSDRDSLLLYTDGVVEARREGEWFDTDGLISAVKASDGSPAELVRGVHGAVTAFVGGRLQDDVCLLALRTVRGEQSPGDLVGRNGEGI